MTIKFGTTQQGARLAVFNDVHNSECSFQPETENGQQLMWLGIIRDFQGNFVHRMLINQEIAMFLLKLLEHFVKTGQVPSTQEEMPPEFGFKPLVKDN